MKIILASSSPRRREILREFGLEFSVKKSEYEENEEESSPELTVLKFAKNKALDVYNGLTDKEKTEYLVIGADTVVYYNGHILGKPVDKYDAKSTLRELSGKTHKVYTGYAVINGKKRVFGVDVSEVLFNDLSSSLIDEYVASGKPLDKAGSYGVQDGFDIVKSVQGSRYNVIGLPIEKLIPILR